MSFFSEGYLSVKIDEQNIEFCCCCCWQTSYDVERNSLLEILCVMNYSKRSKQKDSFFFTFIPSLQIYNL